MTLPPPLVVSIVQCDDAPPSAENMSMEFNADEPVGHEFQHGGIVIQHVTLVDEALHDQASASRLITHLLELGAILQNEAAMRLALRDYGIAMWLAGREYGMTQTADTPTTI